MIIGTGINVKLYIHVCINIHVGKVEFDFTLASIVSRKRVKIR